MERIVNRASLTPLILAAAALLLMWHSPGALAQSCYPVYSGCSQCMWSAGGQTGYSSVCATNSATAYPSQIFNTNVPGLGWTNVSCNAVNPLPASGQVCAPPDQNFVFRFYSRERRDHLYTLNRDEWSTIPDATYVTEGVAFIAYVSPIDANMLPLHRCYNPRARDHFVSPDANCEGQRYEGTFGYVSSIPRAGWVALHRFYNNGFTDHLITKDYNEGASWGGAAYEGTLGYVPQ